MGADNNGLRLAACIVTSRLHEPIEHAIDTLLRLPRGTISWIVVQSVDGRHHLKAAQRKALDDAGLSIVDSCNVQDDLPDACEAVVWVPPECNVSPVGFASLLREVRRQGQTRKTHFSMTTVRRLQPSLRNSFWYGFLVILQAIDTFWTWFDRWRHPLDHYVRLVYVTSIGSRRFLAQRQWVWRLRNGGEHPSLDGTGGAAVIESVMSGHDQVVAALRRHDYLGRLSSPFGNLWAMGWWGTCLALIITLAPQVGLTLFGGTWFISSLLLYFMVRSSLQTPGLVALCTLWPAYLLAFPLVLVYARLFSA